MASLMNCKKCFKKEKKNPIKTLSKNRKDHFPTHSMRPVLPNSKAKERHYKNKTKQTPPTEQYFL